MRLLIGLMCHGRARARRATAGGFVYNSGDSFMTDLAMGIC